MTRYRGRNLDPTALYAAFMTVACLAVSTCPGSSAGADVVAHQPAADVVADQAIRCVASDGAPAATPAAELLKW